MKADRASADDAREWLPEMLERYRAGDSVRELARMVPVSRTTLRRLIADAGLTVRTPTAKAILPIDPRWWSTQFEAGQTVTRIAADHQVNSDDGLPSSDHSWSGSRPATSLSTVVGRAYPPKRGLSALDRCAQRRRPTDGYLRPA